MTGGNARTSLEHLWVDGAFWLGLLYEIIGKLPDLSVKR